MLGAYVVANEFIKLGVDEGNPVDHLKLQKLLYLSQGWHLAMVKKPLFPDPIEAWPYGPILPTIYEIFKAYGKTPICNYDKSITINEPTEVKFIKNCWDTYKDFTGVQLSAITHRDNTPWKKFIKTKNHTICSTDISMFFDKELEKYRNG